MDTTDTAKDLFLMLQHDLKHVVYREHGVRSISYRTLPPTTDKMYRGIRLQDVIVPKIKGTGHELENILATWEHEQVEKPARSSLLQHENGKVICRFIEANYRFKPKMTAEAVMLVFMLGRTDGATVERDDDSLMVEKDGVRFGYSNGKLIHRFKHMIELAHTPLSRIIDAEGKGTTTDYRFIAIYKEALRISKDCADAVLALNQAGSRQMKNDLLSLIIPRAAPTDAEKDRIENILMFEPLPVPKVFALLVPKYMKWSEFSRYMTSKEARKEFPTMKARMRILHHIQGILWKHNDRPRFIERTGKWDY